MSTVELLVIFNHLFWLLAFYFLEWRKRFLLLWFNIYIMYFQQSICADPTNIIWTLLIQQMFAIILVCIAILYLYHFSILIALIYAFWAKGFVIIDYTILKYKENINGAKKQKPPSIVNCLHLIFTILVSSTYNTS